MLNNIKEFIDAGLNVHLLKEYSKNPINQNWLNEDVTYEEIIKEYSIYPNSNIGVKLGTRTKIGGRYLYVIELDVSTKDSIYLTQAYNKLLSIYSDIKLLPRIKTSSEYSSHFYFLSKQVITTKLIAKSDEKEELIIDGVTSLKSKWQIQLLGEEAQTLLPPSKFNGREYEFDINLNLIDMITGAPFGSGVASEMIIDDVSFLKLDEEVEKIIIKEDNSQKRINDFKEFLEKDKVTIESLKNKIKEINIVDYEIDIFVDVISEKLSESLGMPYKITAVRKLITKLLIDIKREEQDYINTLSIGIDNTLATMILKVAYNESKHIFNINGLMYHYESGVWIELEHPVFENRVLETLKFIISSDKEEYSNINLVIKKNKLNDDLNRLTDRICNLIKKMTAVSSADDVLNLRNTRKDGMSVFNTLNKEIYVGDNGIEVKDHSYDSYLTSKFNVVYDEKADCPTWKKLLKDYFKTIDDCDDVVRHFCEIMGYAIQNDKWMQSFIVMRGIGGEGKSFLLKMIMDMLGINNCLLIDLSNFFNNTHATAELMGKYLVIDDDFKKGTVLNDSIIKKFSENKDITVNKKYHNGFNITTQSMTIINANNPIKLSDTSRGLVRRGHVFWFYTLIEDSLKNPLLAKKLRAEFSGFFNLLLESFVNLRKRYRFDVPQSMQNNLTEWLEGSNPLITFLNEKYIITKSSTDKSVTLQQAFNRYKEYMELENESIYKLTKNNFKEDLKAMGINIYKNPSSQVQYLVGVKSRM